jgi:hypothetical protein
MNENILKGKLYFLSSPSSLLSWALAASPAPWWTLPRSYLDYF